jgi:Tfp pilus assembly protein PilF
VYDKSMPQQMTVHQAIVLAEQLKSAGKPAEAEKIYRQILQADLRNVFTMNRLGICLGEANRLGEARDIFQKATETDPTFPDAWSNLSLACERLEDLDRAIAVRRKAIKISPNASDHWHRLGVCLGKKEDFPAAIEALQKSIELNPQAATVYHDLVLALGRDGQLDAAEEMALRRISTAKVVDIDMVRTLGDKFKATDNFSRAAGMWRRIAELDPLCHEARGQLAMCLIAMGQFEEGWAMYESRWDCESFGENTRRDPKRQWGHPPVGLADVSGKTILIYAEQGIGDTIQFVRYATLLSQRGARVIVQAAWTLKSLLQTCPGVRLVYDNNEDLPAYDWHIPMLSLPHVFGTIAGNIPAEIPYLSVDPSRRKSWAARIQSAAPAGTRLRVGITWAGNPKHKNDANRSIHPDLLAPLANVPNVAFFSLQKANENEKAAVQPRELRLIDFTSLLHDFAETAAMIDHLDLIICADTAVAHLAGALGKPVWTLLPFVPDFRWGLKEPQTPWYPTMRLFRQPKPADWPTVIDAVAKALKSRADDANPRE